MTASTTFSQQKIYSMSYKIVTTHDFAKEAKKYVPEVVMTTVETTITKEEEAQCQDICDSLGVRYRIRPFED